MTLIFLYASNYFFLHSLVVQIHTISYALRWITTLGNFIKLSITNTSKKF
jgi:hypothetical protein